MGLFGLGVGSRLAGMTYPTASQGGVVLREAGVGDFGWIVWRHGVVYAAEQGWDERFEGLVARIMADFTRGHDAARERCWIAEIEGEPVGSVMLVGLEDRVAKLRVLLVEPRARGRGVGRALVQACIDFARGAGYEKVVLWTNSALAAARGLYIAMGFIRVGGEIGEDFGAATASETWELAL
ncbi:MAG: GNAT family N-acetyltransferase [Phycisphaerales bacterium]|nr:GNAT family N-acetyltransferase [Phycisphaerales bacterium]